MPVSLPAGLTPGQHGLIEAFRLDAATILPSAGQGTGDALSLVKKDTPSGNNLSKSLAQVQP